MVGDRFRGPRPEALNPAQVASGCQPPRIDVTDPGHRSRLR
jgi:hypothetical protein